MSITVKGTLKSGAQYDLSEIISEPEWYTSIDGQPGKFSFKILDDPNVFYKNGDVIEFSNGGKTYFKGKIFKRQKTKDDLWQITAYDNLRYLQNEDTIVFDASTAAERFKRICETQGLPYKIGMAPGYKCAAVVADGKTYFTMLDEALQETRRAANDSRYTFYDDAGTVKFVALQELNTPLLLGDKSLISDYDYESSIDDAFNAIKVVRENEKKKTREVYVASDSKTISEWGKLQKVEKANDADLNAQQLQQMAKDKLRELNAVGVTFKLDSVGDFRIRAGNSFNLVLEDMQREWGRTQCVVLVHSCTHRFSPVHTMSLDVEVVH